MKNHFLNEMEFHPIVLFAAYIIHMPVDNQALITLELVKSKQDAACGILLRFHWFAQKMWRLQTISGR